ncbi:MAG: alpha/beta hydrolase [Bacteroidetes bacterium]|nr:MAG: alpha/beta hydrolase [Bacteroidota bacterium]
MRIIIALIGLALLWFSCKKANLDSFAFPSKKIDHYEFEKYALGELGDLPKEYDIDPAQRSLVTMSSTDAESGETYTLYGVYIGDVSTIATDTVILYLHGQGKHMDFYWTRAALLAHLGGKYHYGVLMVDYRGYGMSEGEASEQGLYEDADAAIDWLLTRGVQNERLIVYGYSLGAIPTIDRLAYREQFSPTRMILESPLASVENLVHTSTLINVNPDYLTDLKFDNAEKIKEVDCPLLWLHGKEDTYIAIENGELIYANHPGPRKEAIRVAQCDHDEIPLKMGLENYLKQVLDFIRK